MVQDVIELVGIINGDQYAAQPRPLGGKGWDKRDGGDQRRHNISSPFSTFTPHLGVLVIRLLRYPGRFSFIWCCAGMWLGLAVFVTPSCVVHSIRTSMAAHSGSLGAMVLRCKVTCLNLKHLDMDYAAVCTREVRKSSCLCLANFRLSRVADVCTLAVLCGRPSPVRYSNESVCLLCLNARVYPALT